MDLISYYNNIREQESSIGEEFPILVSNDTGDGGKAGRLTEAPKAVAARMIVQGLARLAPAEQAEAFRATQAAAARDLAELAAAGRVQLSVMATADLEKLKTAANLKG
jgi:hypothetical protein